MPRPEGIPSIHDMHDHDYETSPQKKLKAAHKKVKGTYVEVVRCIGVSKCDEIAVKCAISGALRDDDERAEHFVRCLEARMACKAELEKRSRADLIERMNRDETLFDKLRGGC